MFEKKELNAFYRYCVVLTNNEDDAYDLLQTALEKFLRSNTKNVIAEKNYMRAIIRNQYIDQYRNKNKYELELYDENNVTEINEGISSFEKMLIEEEEAGLIWKILTDAEREIMFLWAIHGLSTSEVAKFLDIPKGTIVSKISRLRKKVINQLSSELDIGAI